MKFILRKMRLHKRLHQYDKVAEAMQLVEKMNYDLPVSRERDEIYYLACHAHYKNSTPAFI